MANEALIADLKLATQADANSFDIINCAGLTLNAGQVVLFQDPAVANDAARKAYVDAENDTLAALYDAELKQASKEKESLDSVRDVLNTELSQGLDAESKAMIRQVASNIRLGIDDPDFATKREVIEALNVQVHLLPDDGGSEREVKITCEIGDDTKLCNDHQGRHSRRSRGICFHDRFL